MTKRHRNARNGSQASRVLVYGQEPQLVLEGLLDAFDGRGKSERAAVAYLRARFRAHLTRVEVDLDRWGAAGLSHRSTNERFEEATLLIIAKVLQALGESAHRQLTQAALGESSPADPEAA